MLINDEYTTKISIANVIRTTYVRRAADQLYNYMCSLLIRGYSSGQLMNINKY